MNELVFIGDLAPYQAEIAGKRKKQYERLLTQADRYQTVELPEVHPKESTNVALRVCNAGAALPPLRRGKIPSGGETFYECGIIL